MLLEQFYKDADKEIIDFEQPDTFISYGYQSIYTMFEIIFSEEEELQDLALTYKLYLLNNSKYSEEVGTSVNIKPLDLYHYSLAIGTLALRLGQENYPTLFSMLTIYLEDTEKAEKILNQWLLESKTLCPCCQHE